MGNHWHASLHRNFFWKFFNTDYPFKNNMGWVVMEHIYDFYDFLSPAAHWGDVLAQVYLSMEAWAHRDPWKVVIRGSINQFHYFRRPKGITHSPIIRLLTLEYQITLLWGKLLSISYEKSYYLMLIRVSDWQLCLINKVWNKNKMNCFVWT